MKPRHQAGIGYIINKTNLHKHGPGLSENTIKLIKPVYLDLMKSSELKNVCMEKYKTKMNVLTPWIGNVLPK